ALHPGAWLLWAACGGLAAMLTTNPFYMVVLCGAAWLVYATQRRSGPQVRSFKILVVFGLVAMIARTALVLADPVVHVAITTSGVVVALLEGARIATLLCVFGTFNAVSDPYGILRLAPRRLYEPMLAAALALSLAPRTIAAVGEVREAQQIRGANVKRVRALPALVVPVLETGMEEALMLAESMDARGHGRGPRTRYRPDRWGASSYAVALSSIIVGSSFVWGAASRSGDLSVSMPPLHWPAASIWVVAAAAVMAAPAFLASEGAGR
ncbi:MAG: energy-coupling factor transporter transmembrane protein EcfT, partial [Actinomycetota bacterium]|nr:energy-coupling factor transporter transmembrane protein EcfT [Actinomycetota bacterium]